MIIAYRYGRKKYQERKARKAAEANGVQPVQGQTAHRAAGAGSSQSTPVLQHEEPAPPKSKGLSAESKWSLLLLAALAIPVFLETLDYTVVATAQVHIASVFNRLDLQSYIGTIYLLTSTVFLPPFASICDIFGRHWALQIALVLFMVGSAISTGAQNMATMIAGRGVAGIGGAGLLAVVRIVLTDSGSLNTTNWQQAILFVLYTIGYCLGPFIGGELLTVSFRWIFAINLPCAAVAMVLASLLLRGRAKGTQPSRRVPASMAGHETFTDKLLRIDWVGAVFFMAGGILLLLALNWGSNERWDQAKVIACFVVGGVCIAVFLLWEYFLEREEVAARPASSRLRATDPMIPLELFRARDICIVMYGTFVSGMIMLVMFYFVAIFFVIVVGKTATNAGVQLIYFAPGMGGGSLIAMQITRLLRQPRYAIWLGGAVSTVAIGLISMGMDQNKQNLVNGFMVMAGAGTGMVIAPYAIQARFAQPADRNAIVSALTLFFRSFGGTVGLAQCAAVLNGKVNHYIRALIEDGTLSPDQAAAVAAASASGLDSLDSINALPGPVQTLVRDAFRQGSRWAFISLIPWCALAFLVSLFLGKIRDGDRGVGNTESPREPDLHYDATKQDASSPNLNKIQEKPSAEQV
ncbi:MFS general substrate transporter [Phanerochaete sordida]|uniref:MFS general substrate transporter n=1 Tax=Phanerochaete sordida TaxID=48140 RepID=A0A9P3GIC7_9APHY|nr:MFS general substrate transporter [Phanerochaete sordida]